jgi:hypothetical protein
MPFLKVIRLFCQALLVPQMALAAENLALRQQLAVMQRIGKRPRIHGKDRFFWVCLSRIWKGWQSALTIVQA